MYWSKYQLEEQVCSGTRFYTKILAFTKNSILLMNNFDKIQTWELKAQPLSCIRRNHFAMKVKKLSAAVKTANDCSAKAGL